MTEKKTKLQKLKDLGLLGAIKTDKKTLYRNLEEKGLIGFLSDECTEKGCRNLETRCLDCDRVVNTAQFGAIRSNSEQLDDGWISVKAKLPTEHVWIEIGSSIEKKTWRGIYMDGKFLEPDLGYKEITNVTHWMPLPEPPKE